MNTPTPRTDAATYPADCLGTTLVTNRDCARALERELTALTAERDHLHAQLRALTLICGTNDANKFETWIDRANARAERAEAAETIALAQWNGALERAMKAEADLAALEQCHDDNCRALVKLDAELADWSVLNAWGGTPEIIHKFVKGQQARIHYCQNIEEDLVAERARLDSGTILLTVAGERVWHCGVNLRAAIDSGIKEGAK